MKARVGIFLALLLMAALLVGLVACKSGETKDTTPEKVDREVAIIVKGIDSDFWQTVIAGAMKAGEDFGVTVKSFGPPTEGDLDQQVTILEDVISKNPDAIVIASTSKEATVPAIEKAFDGGMPVVLIDGGIESDKYTTFLATDNEVAGGRAAEEMVRQLEKLDKPLSGEVCVISAMAGVQSLTARNDGFKNKLKELAPDLEIVDTRYSEGDIMKAVQIAEDMLTAYPDVVAFFADNNQCGDALAQIIKERGLKDDIVAIAFDADDVAIEALKEGHLKGIVVQDPYGMGYMGVEAALKTLDGEKLEKYVDTGSLVATVENMEEQKVKDLLYPPVK